MQKLDWGIFEDDLLIAATPTEARAKSWARDLLGKNGWEVRRLDSEPCRTLAGLVESYYADTGLPMPGESDALTIASVALTGLVTGMPNGHHSTRGAIGALMLGLVAYATAIGTDPVACLLEFVESDGHA